MMKSLISLLLILPFVAAKKVETVDEIFECTANDLRDRDLLEKGFTYSVQSKSLDCETFLYEKKDLWVDETIHSIVEDAKETKNSIKRMYLNNPSCFHKQLNSMNFLDVIMKTFVYSHSDTLDAKQKKMLMEKMEDEKQKMFNIASTICSPEKLLETTFDEAIELANEEGTFQNNLSEYCVRKFILDSNLIDTKVYEVALNPGNLDIPRDLDCAGYLKFIFKQVDKTIKKQFSVHGNQTMSQLQCFDDAIKESDAIKFSLRLAVIIESSKMSDELKVVESKKHRSFMKELFEKMAKCMR